jgi:hypothetical protein
MVPKIIWMALLCAACSAPQPTSLKTVAAYEINLPTDADKARFLRILRKVAEEDGYHVDAASAPELAAMSDVSPITFNASVWRGEDEESMASAMDFQDRIGRVWLSFPKGENPDRSTRFRGKLIKQVQLAWPDATRLPVMPNGGLPLTGDLVRTSSGYAVKASERAKYEDRGE